MKRRKRGRWQKVKRLDGLRCCRDCKVSLEAEVVLYGGRSGS